MDYQAYGHSAAANGRRGLSRLRFVLIGALAPLALFALPVGTMMLVGPTGESAPAAGSGPALDCGSSRNAWRPACQAAKTNLVRDADVTGSINERAATAGEPDPKAKRRPIVGTVASAPANPAASPPAKASAQVAPPSPSPAQTQVAQAPPNAPDPGVISDVARPEPSPLSGPRAEARQDPPVDLAQPTTAPAPRSPALSQSGLAKAAQDQAPEPGSAQASAPSLSRTPVREEKPDSASANAPVPTPKNAVAASADPAPARKVKSLAARGDSETEPVDPPSRRNLRRAARPTLALAIRAKTRVKVVTARDTEEPVKVIRRRVRLVRAEEPEEVSHPAAHVRHASRRIALRHTARDTEEPVKVVRRRVRLVRAEEPEEVSHPAAHVRHASRRIALRHEARRHRALRNQYAGRGGLRVFSVQTYYLPDGRQVLVNVSPQLGVVRELEAQHAAAFSGRRAVLTRPVSTPSWGGPSWGGPSWGGPSWGGPSWGGNWFGFDD